MATFENPPLRACVPGLEFAGNVDDLAALVAPRSLTLLNVNPGTSRELAAKAYRLSRAAAEFRCQSASISFSLSYGPTTGGQVVDESGVKALKVPGSQP